MAILTIGGFCIINAIIILQDIRHRIIPNKYLGILIGLLPFWMYAFPIKHEIFIMHGIISILTILIGILFYTKHEIIGAGDFKYIAILFLFLGDASISILLSNIGILTIGLLIIWWSLLVGVILGVHGSYQKIRDFLSNHLLKIPDTTIVRNITLTLLDWGVIGYALSLGIREIFLFLPMSQSTMGDVYFTSGICIFLVRPWIRNLLETSSGKRIVTGVLLGVIGKLVYDSGYVTSFILWSEYIKNILPYAIVLNCIYLITKYTFIFSDAIIIENNILKINKITIPYSILIFGGFCLHYFYEIALIVKLENWMH